ncbi:MAG TPA: DUF3108 domain-containing protein [Candidatus Dormibacteraeota bacterium]|jgi:hypothetical protein|nr:DUF3108 domain-containing protein [Candidatus Dormibacteraeota bacterium]
MSNRTTFAMVFVAALVGGAVLWQMYNQREVSRASAAVAVTSSKPGAIAEEPKAGRVAESKEMPARASDAARQPVDRKKTAVVADAGLPLRAGETWQYSANVSKLNNVANLRLKVAEKRNFLGKSAWHLQAFAHTENPLRMVFALDDQFDSYSDAATLVSLQYEMHLNEKGQTVDSVQRMSPAVREPAPANAIAAQVLPGTRDPLGMMQYLRTVDWAKTPEVRSPVYDGHKLYDVHARLQARGEPVTVPAGNFNTLKIELQVLDNGVELKDAHFILYLSNTEARLPVLLEAVMPFAVARVELVKAE